MVKIISAALVSLLCSMPVIGLWSVEYEEPEPGPTLESEVEAAPPEIMPALVEESTPVPVEPTRGGNLTEVRTARCLGEFKIYHYAPTGSRTASGTWPTVGHTIAVDPKVIPLGTEVSIDGVTYVAEDTGGDIKGNTIDIFVESNAVARQLGVKWVQVYVYDD
jgi:3D (Asp-Asp-Asp) domain-containing protein